MFSLHVEPHALDRFRDVQPTADETDLLDTLVDSWVEGWMSHDLVWAVTARRNGWDGIDNYYLDRSLRGIFIVRWSDENAARVVGFLRLHTAQRKILQGRFRGDA